jgi:cyclic pyranopterin phosphate synthase
MTDDHPDPAGSRAGETGGVDDPRPDATDEREGADTADLTHTDETGTVDMVDVGAKPASKRRAVARGTIHLRPATVAAVRENDLAKGDVLTTARIGAVQAVKRTPEAIPLCHQLPVSNVDTDFELGESTLTLSVTVETTAQTGCEMEALEGVTTGLNVVWDMVKAAEKDAAGQYPGTRISDVQVVEKVKRPVE